jgi:AbrB family looped-hinge helix DNA binding protein
MATTKLSDKGSLLLPKAVRDAHNWAPGTEFEVIDQGDGVLFRPIPKKRYTLDDLSGCLPYDGPPKSLEEMERGIDEAMRERWAQKSGLL